ncbi:hypothetical protein N0V90_013192 [Kalmusia sp. IMI 367209]|nr:hypothetical protein N0V90_013192 [Kalmusia sp. IMI 367209]
MFLKQQRSNEHDGNESTSHKLNINGSNRSNSPQSDTSQSSHIATTQNSDESTSEEMAPSPEEICMIFQYFNVDWDSRTPIPAPLQVHIDILMTPLDRCSPNAKCAANKAPRVRGIGERDPRADLADVLLLKPARNGGHPFLNRIEDIQLCRNYSPTCIDKIGKQYIFPQAQPDQCFGYITSRHVDHGDPHPFTKEEEKVLNEASLHSTMYFPILTAQWKSGAQTHYHAIPQGARDGAVILNHRSAIFKRAACPADQWTTGWACHFSVTIDGRTVMVWVHWFDEAKQTYHMETIDQIFLDYPDQVSRFRMFLHNLEDFYMGPQLLAFKRAVAALREVVEERSNRRQRTVDLSNMQAMFGA